MKPKTIINKKLTIETTANMDEKIKRVQKSVKRYLKPNDDLVKMLFEDRKQDYANEH